MYIEVCDCCGATVEKNRNRHSIEYDYDIHPHNGDLMSKEVILCHSCMVEAVIDLKIKHKKPYDSFVGAYEVFYPKKEEL